MVVNLGWYHFGPLSFWGGLKGKSDMKIIEKAQGQICQFPTFS